MITVLSFALRIPSEMTAERVSRRVDSQFDRGLLDEIRNLLASGVPERAHPFTGLVYRQALEHLRGVRGEAATRELIVRENRRYARRQLIWFRKEPNLQWIYAAGESESARDYSWERQRSWKVASSHRTNRHGSATAYKLVPGAAFPVMMDPSSPQYRRAPVIGHTLWVTRNHEDERWPAGAYPTQSHSDDGMTRWIADDEPLEDTDVVLWYVFGIHHITRVEEWPIMPSASCGFTLEPLNFFDRNPTLDVPANGCHHT